jgi:Ca2+-binding RTX toxin-like protein
MASVSVPGPGGTTITQTVSNSFNSALAKSIADALANAANKGDLFIQTVTGSVSAPVNDSGKIGELVVIPGSIGDVTVPSGSNYSFVVDDSVGPDTIHGSTSLSIMGGAGVHTIIDPAVITLSDNAIGNVTLTNGGDTVAAGDGAATVNATASSEAVLGGGGKLTASVSGTGSEVVGGTAALTALVTGTSDTVFGGSGAAAVTLSGSTKAVVVGNIAGLSVLDTGTGDTIDAGVSFTSVTAPGGSFVRGGSGPLNFIGGTGPSTIVGGSGPETVFGAKGLTSILGNSGGSVTYVNTTAGGLSYVAASGSETLDASLSMAPSSLFGGQNTSANDLIVGGAGSDLFTGSAGSDTLVGGGGQNGFYFWAGSGGPTASHVISDFSAIDYVVLGNYGSGAAAAAIAGSVTTAGSTTITLSDNTKITFTGVTSSSALSGHVVSI